MPDPNNPDDANKDGVYEVEIAYVNTTAGDPNVPIPKSEQRIEINPKSEEIFRAGYQYHSCATGLTRSD